MDYSCLFIEISRGIQSSRLGLSRINGGLLRYTWVGGGV